MRLQGKKGAGSQANSARGTPEAGTAEFSDDQQQLLAAAATAATGADGGQRGDEEVTSTAAAALAPEAAVADLKGWVNMLLAGRT